MIDRRAFLVLGGAATVSATVPILSTASATGNWHHICYHCRDGWINYFVDGELHEIRRSKGSRFMIDYWTNGKYVTDLRITDG